MKHTNIITYIAENASNYPTKVAYHHFVNNKWVPVNWDTMNNSISKISLALLNDHIKPQDNIAIFADNMPDWMMADIGIMGIGAVTVPVYASNSTQELEYIINDAEISLLFVGGQQQYDQAKSLINNNQFLQKIVIIDPSVEIEELEHTQSFDDFTNIELTPEKVQLLTQYHQQIKGSDLMSIIYTSGTTGEPKGVMLDHQNIIETAEAHVTDLDLNPNETSLSFLPLSHIFERIWVIFCLSQTIPIYFNEDPKRIAEVLKETKPTLMCSVPRLFEKIYSTIQEKKNSASLIKKALLNWAVAVGNKYNNEHLMVEKEPSGLLNFQFKLADKLVLSKIREAMGGQIHFMPCGGAPISEDIFRFFHAIGVNMKCGYGLTEVTATATLSQDHHINFKSAGKPLTGVQVKIGANDEILIKGPGVMKGYYKKEAQTALVFEDGWFKTGDAGKIDENGNLIITDRIKDLMKTSGGKYVAPQKIETNLVNDIFIEQIAIIGDHRKFVSALIVPNFETLRHYCDHKGYTYEDIKDVIVMPEIINKFERNLAKFQKDFSPHEMIRKFTLLKNEFTMEAGELTPTLKIKRKVIAAEYKDVIDQMYD